jgi:hypothetical protein
MALSKNSYVSYIIFSSGFDSSSDDPFETSQKVRQMVSRLVSENFGGALDLVRISDYMFKTRYLFCLMALLPSSVKAQVC